MASYPTSHGDFILWLGNFIKVARDNQSALGLTIADIGELETILQDTTDALTQQVAAQEAARAATANMDTTRTSANTTVSYRSRAISINPNIPDSLKEQLGLNVADKKRGTVPLHAPTGLVVEGGSEGTNKLRWERNGNIPGTQFIIEARIADSKEFAFVAVTTKTTYNHRNQKPGVFAVYRLRATRSDELSGYSNEVVIYLL